MGVMTDATGRLLVNAVGGVDTSGLVKDTTVQTTNSKLDDIKAAINTISSAISPEADNVAYDNTASGLSATNVQSAIDEVVNIYNPVITDHNIPSDSPVTVANDTYVTIDDFIIDPGTYLFFATYIFTANNNGYRYILLTNNATGTGGWYGMSNRVNAVNITNQTTTVSISGAAKVTASTHVYVRVRQNSGSSLNIYGRIRPVKIG